jgi:hypothetical protein
MPRNRSGRKRRATPDPFASRRRATRPAALNIALSFSHHFAQNRAMESETGPQAPPKSLLRWATTPPQSYVVYLVCLILIRMVSFYAGTLKPKKAVGLGPPPISTPQK